MTGIDEEPSSGIVGVSEAVLGLAGAVEQQFNVGTTVSDDENSVDSTVVSEPFSGSVGVHIKVKGILRVLWFTEGLSRGREGVLED